MRMAGKYLSTRPHPQFYIKINLRNYKVYYWHSSFPTRSNYLLWKTSWPSLYDKTSRHYMLCSTSWTWLWKVFGGRGKAIFWRSVLNHAFRCRLRYRLNYIVEFSQLHSPLFNKSSVYLTLDLRVVTLNKSYPDPNDKCYNLQLIYVSPVQMDLFWALNGKLTLENLFLDCVTTLSSHFTSSTVGNCAYAPLFLFFSWLSKNPASHLLSFVFINEVELGKINQLILFCQRPMGVHLYQLTELSFPGYIDQSRCIISSSGDKCCHVHLLVFVFNVVSISLLSMHYINY